MMTLLNCGDLAAGVETFQPIYRTCSQVSFAVLNEQFKLNADKTIPALQLFAGGIAGHGETCGAVIGALLAMGVYFEPVHQEAVEGGSEQGAYANQFFDRFTSAFCSTRCREVVKYQYGRYYDFTNPEEKISFMAVSQKNGKCMEVVKKAVLIAGDIIMDAS